MKKIFAILTAALMAAVFTACNNGSADEKATSVASETSEQSAADESSAASESSEIKLSELSSPEKAGDMLKKGLKTFLTELDKDNYRLNIYMTTSNGDPKVVIITRSGENITAATGETEDKLSKSLVKDNKGYVIDDEAKTVTWAEFDSGYAEGYTEYLASLFYVTNIDSCKTGKEKYGTENKEMDYEEYKIVIEESSSASSESSSTEEQYVRYYFDNGTLAGMKVINGDEYYSMQIKSLTDKIPDGEFDIPSDYKLIKAEESSAVSEEETSKETSETTSASSTAASSGNVSSQTVSNP